MIRESFRNDSGTVPRSLRTSRARADQGAGSREWSREIGHFRIPNLRSARAAMRGKPMTGVGMEATDATSALAAALGLHHAAVSPIGDGLEGHYWTCICGARETSGLRWTAMAAMNKADLHVAAAVLAVLNIDDLRSYLANPEHRLATTRNALAACREVRKARRIETLSEQNERVKREWGK